MKLAMVKLTNFRGYSECTEIPIENLTAFVGKNDVGKSTILEALDIFFNGNCADSSMSKEDVSQKAFQADGEEAKVEIACVFSNLHPENGRRKELAETTIQRSISLMRQYLHDKGFAQIERKKQALAQKKEVR